MAKTYYDIIRQHSNLGLQNALDTVTPFLNNPLEFTREFREERVAKGDKGDSKSNLEKIHRFNNNIKSVHSAFEIIEQVGKQSNDDNLIKFACIGDASLKMIDAGMQLFSSSAAIGAASSGAMVGLSAVHPVAAFITASLTVINLLSSRKKSEPDMVSQAFLKYLKDISIEMRNLHLEMVEIRELFKHSIENQKLIYNTICEGFAYLADVISQQINDLKMPVIEGITRIEDSLNYVMKTLSDGQQSISLQPLTKLLYRIKARLEGTETYDVQSQIQKIHSEILDYLRLRGLLTLPIFNKSNLLSHQGRHSIYQIVNTIFSDARDPEIAKQYIGFLAWASVYFLDNAPLLSRNCLTEDLLQIENLSSSISCNDPIKTPQQLVACNNEMINGVFDCSWITSSYYYTLLREKFHEMIPDREFIGLDSIVASGKNQLLFLRSLQCSRSLFQNLFNGYKQARKEIADLIETVVYVENNSHGIDVRNSPETIKSSFKELQINIQGNFFDAKPTNGNISTNKYNISNWSLPVNNFIEINQIFGAHPSILLAHKLDIVSISGNFHITLECLGYRSEPGHPEPDLIAYFTVVITMQFGLDRAQIHLPYSIHVKGTHRHNIGDTPGNRLDDDTASYYFGPVFNNRPWNPQVPQIDTLITQYNKRRSPKKAVYDNFNPFAKMMDQVIEATILQKRKTAIEKKLFEKHEHSSILNSAIMRINAYYKLLNAYAMTAGFRQAELSFIIDKLWTGDQIIKHIKEYSLSSSTGINTALPSSTLVPEFDNVQNAILQKIDRNDRSYFQNSMATDIQSIIKRLLFLKNLEKSRKLGETIQRKADEDAEIFRRKREEEEFALKKKIEEEKKKAEDEVRALQKKNENETYQERIKTILRTSSYEMKKIYDKYVFYYKNYWYNSSNWKKYIPKEGMEDLVKNLVKNILGCVDCDMQDYYLPPSFSSEDFTVIDSPEVLLRFLKDYLINFNETLCEIHTGYTAVSPEYAARFGSPVHFHFLIDHKEKFKKLEQQINQVKLLQNELDSASSQLPIIFSKPTLSKPITEKEESKQRSPSPLILHEVIESDREPARKDPLPLVKKSS